MDIQELMSKQGEDMRLGRFSSFASIFPIPSSPAPLGAVEQDSLVDKLHPGTDWEPPRVRWEELTAELFSATETSAFGRNPELDSRPPPGDRKRTEHTSSQRSRTGWLWELRLLDSSAAAAGPNGHRLRWGWRWGLPQCPLA